MLAADASVSMVRIAQTEKSSRSGAPEDAREDGRVGRGGVLQAAASRAAR